MVVASKGVQSCRPDSRGWCGRWERQEGCPGGWMCGGLQPHLWKKIATGRWVRRGDRLLLTRQCGPGNGWPCARGRKGARKRPPPTKTQRQARKRRTSSRRLSTYGLSCCLFRTNPAHTRGEQGYRQQRLMWWLILQDAEMIHMIKLIRTGTAHPPPPHRRVPFIPRLYVVAWKGRAAEKAIAKGGRP